MEVPKMKFHFLNYCQYLISSQTNYTLTNLANHLEDFSHDQINRYLKSEKLTPRLIWENVRNEVQSHPQGAVIFDDTVEDKRFSQKIELVRRQYSGNEHGVIRGIGIVNCVYVNPETGDFWIIDYRIYDPDGDGKTKLDHVKDMLLNVVYHKQLLFQKVLMDSWYATKKLMLLIEKLGKTYYCPLKKNRLVDDTRGQEDYQRIEHLAWTKEEQKKGKLIKINKFPKDHKVKLFRVIASTGKTEYLATNDLKQSSIDEVKKECKLRWKVEEFHREIKQLTGLEACQCRKARIQRNHIACAFLVWNYLKKIASNSLKTIYQLKSDLLSEYLNQELKCPSLKMTLILNF